MMLLALIFAAENATTGFDGLSLTLGGTLGAAIVGGLVKIYTSRKHAEATAIPQPCKVERVNDCVSVQECNRRMRELDDRMTKLEARVAVGFDNIMRKLDAIDRRGEERSAAVFERINPIAEKVGNMQGQLEIIKTKVLN